MPWVKRFPPRSFFSDQSLSIGRQICRGWSFHFFLFVNVFSETDCKENLIVFIVIVNVTIRRRPWSSSISAHVLVPWYYLSLILVGRCPILITLIICIRSCIDYQQGVYLLRPPLTWQLSLQRARLLVSCILDTFWRVSCCKHVLIWHKCPYLFLYCTLRWDPGHSIFTSA